VQEAKGQIPMDKEAEDITYQLFRHGFAPTFKDSFPECKSLKDGVPCYVLSKCKRRGIQRLVGTH
jgi:hypothetical protein